MENFQVTASSNHIRKIVCNINIEDMQNKNIICLTEYREILCYYLHINIYIYHEMILLSFHSALKTSSQVMTCNKSLFQSMNTKYGYKVFI